MRRAKYWEIIADNLSKAGWSWGCVSAIEGPIASHSAGCAGRQGRGGPLYPRLSALMTRRHQIVHRADLVDVPGGERKATLIDAATVTEWAAAVKEFFAHVLADKALQDIIPKLKRKHSPKKPNRADDDPPIHTEVR